MSILLNRVSGLTCSVYHLRLFNVEVTAYVAAAAILCRSRIEQPRTENGGPGQFSAYAVGTGLNVALFPVMFFFSGLYYTDVISTFVVLVAHVNQLRRLGRRRYPPFFDSYLTFSWGLLALCMRQTNVFWVVVFMGGLEVVHHIKSLKAQPVGTPYFSTLAEQIRFYAWRYSVGDIHDPPLNMAAPIGENHLAGCTLDCSSRTNLSDLVLCVISISIAAIYNIRTILLQGGALPHLLVLSAFVGFVVVNGGVVLGIASSRRHSSLTESVLILA